MVPRLFLPSYRATPLVQPDAMVSMPVLNPQTPINQDFDQFRLMESHNDMRAMFDHMRFYVDRPSFFLLNVGETHYPYARPDEDTSNWPRIRKSTASSRASTRTYGRPTRSASSAPSFSMRRR